MKEIKFYSEHDFSCGIMLKHIVEKINSEGVNFNWDINDLFDFFNILKFLGVKRFEEYIVEETGVSAGDLRKEINQKCGTFVNNHKNEYLQLIDQISLHSYENFFEVFDRYEIYKVVEGKDFKCFIEMKKNYLHVVLKYKKLVMHYDFAIKDILLSQPQNAEIILLKYLNENKANLPVSLRIEEMLDLISKYIDSQGANPNYLDKIMTFPSNNDLKINDKIKLRARRKYNEIIDTLFDKESAPFTEVTVSCQKNQCDSMQFHESKSEENGRRYNFTFSQDWIEENSDFPTLWNNFIYVFGFADINMRITFVSKDSDVSGLAGLFTPKAKHLYKKSLVFDKIEMINNAQLVSYIAFLSSLGIELEQMIKWFFESYLNEEFNVRDFLVSVPSKNSTFLEKCKNICPEIDRTFKQYNAFVEDDFIDQELIQISSSSFKANAIKSLNKKKYVYSSSTWSKSVMFLLFSDQSGIFYIENTSEKYQNFSELLISENLTKSDFAEYQVREINWLLENNLLQESSNGTLKFSDNNLIFILKDLYRNEVINYWNYPDYLRVSVDELSVKGHIIFENSLFTRSEQDYLDYYLNNSKFTNGLAIRNRYSHGSNSINEEQHETDYYALLKIFIIIIIKINDDLCIRDKVRMIELSE